jgi:hypothetical protein
MTRVRGDLDYNPLTGQRDPYGAAIPFTQYLLPRGERRPISITRPFAITQKAKRIMELGYKFEAEILTNGTVSLTIAGKNIDVGIVLCQNLPAEVAKATDKLVMEFDEATAKQLDEEAG